MVTDLERLYVAGFATLLAAYFVWDALHTGETFVTPVQRFRRDKNPGAFWLIVGALAFMGLVSLGWAVHFALRVS